MARSSSARGLPMRRGPTGIHDLKEYFRQILADLLRQKLERHELQRARPWLAGTDKLIEDFKEFHLDDWDNKSCESLLINMARLHFKFAFMERGEGASTHVQREPVPRYMQRMRRVLSDVTMSARDKFASALDLVVSGEHERVQGLRDIHGSDVSDEKGASDSDSDSDRDRDRQTTPPRSRSSGRRLLGFLSSDSEDDSDLDFGGAFRRTGERRSSTSAVPAATGYASPFSSTIGRRRVQLGRPDVRIGSTERTLGEIGRRSVTPVTSADSNVTRLRYMIIERRLDGIERNVEELLKLARDKAPAPRDVPASSSASLPALPRPTRALGDCDRTIEELRGDKSSAPGNVPASSSSSSSALTRRTRAPGERPVDQGPAAGKAKRLERKESVVAPASSSSSSSASSRVLRKRPAARHLSRAAGKRPAAQLLSRAAGKAPRIEDTVGPT